MKIHNYIYISLFFLLLGSIASCGGVDKTLKRGDAAMAIGEYCEAAAQYRKAYSRTPSKEREQRGIVAYKMGDAYRRYGNSARALGAFRNAAR